MVDKNCFVLNMNMKKLFFFFDFELDLMWYYFFTVYSSVNNVFFLLTMFQDAHLIVEFFNCITCSNKYNLLTLTNLVFFFLSLR